MLPTWYAGAQGHKTNGCYRVLDVKHTAKIGGCISDDGRENANDEYGNNEGDISAAYVCGMQMVLYNKWFNVIY